MNRPVILYLAGPIDAVSKEEARGWREEIASIAPVGVAFYSPAHAYLNVSAANFSKADRANRIAIAHICDGVLVNFVNGVSFGSTREIEFARMNNKPVAVAGEIKSLMQSDLLVADTVERALVFLLEVIQEDRDTPHPLQYLFGIGRDDETQ